MKILRDYWFSGLGPLIGIVAGVDDVTGEGKAYIGVGQGIDQEADAKYVAKTGAKLPLAILDEIRALLAPPGEKTATKAEVLDALKAQHEAIDRLFAQLIERDNDFRPSKSGQPWEAARKGNAIIQKLSV